MVSLDGTPALGDACVPGVMGLDNLSLGDLSMSTSRRSLLTAAAAPALASAAGVAMSASASLAAAPAGARADPVVRELVERSTQAHAALMQGDAALYGTFITLADDYTLMSPFGGTPSHGPYSAERWASIGRFFSNGRASTLEVVEAYRVADMVVLAAIERTHVEVGGLPAQHWALRVTLVFRKDGQAWHQVHRHADPLAPGISLEQAAALARGAASAKVSAKVSA
jgi:ketosteroid isomerase-like protein